MEEIDKDRHATERLPRATPRPPAVILPRPALRRSRIAFAIVVMSAYVGLGLTAYWPVLPWSTNRLFGGTTPDPGLTVWFLGSVAHALIHGQNLFFSNAILVPNGLNLAQNTSVPLLGILVAPITLVFGPVVSTNLLMVLAMPISASAAFIVLRKWQLWGPAAAIGGLIYGFSPYMVGQGLAHLSLTFMPLPPFVALTVVSLLQQGPRPNRLGVYLGVLLAAQFLISPETLTTVAILTAFGLLFAGIRFRVNLRATARALLVPTGIALALAAILIAYPVYMMVYGPQHFSGPVWPLGNAYYNDLLSFLVPGPLQRVAFGMRTLGINLIGGSNPQESGGYIGVPLFLLAVSLALRSRRSIRMQLAVIVGGAAAVLSLGPYLAIDGHLSNIPLPALVLTKIPLLNNILPVRLSLEVDACLAAALAFGLADMRCAPVHVPVAPRDNLIMARMVSGVVITAIIVTQFPQWPYASQPAPGLPVSVRQIIPQADPVAIIYPYAGPYNSDPMLWQAEDDFQFRLLGGYALHPGPTGQATVWPNLTFPPGLQRFLVAGTPPTIFGPAPPLNAHLVASTRSLLIHYDVRLILVDRRTINSNSAVKLFTRALGPARRSGTDFVLWVSSKRPL